MKNKIPKLKINTEYIDKEEQRCEVGGCHAKGTHFAFRMLGADYFFCDAHYALVKNTILNPVGNVSGVDVTDWAKDVRETASKSDKAEHLQQGVMSNIEIMEDLFEIYSILNCYLDYAQLGRRNYEEIAERLQQAKKQRKKDTPSKMS